MDVIKLSQMAENKPIFSYKPLNRFMYKLTLQVFLIVSLVSTGLWLLAGFIVWVSQFDNGKDITIGQDWIILCASANIILIVVITLLALIITYIYTKWMSFHIYSNEIVVEKGVVNKTEKHVPYRTVTNISTRYGVFDKLFGIGTVEIETAGKSGQSMGPEEKIEGIRNFVEVRNIVLEELRKFRGQYATGTEVGEISKIETESDPKLAILQELRDIKQVLEEKL